jgi:hypothetical protein
MKRIISAALAATAVLVLAPSAQADSISFLRGGDIWVASADGNQQVQVTTNGGYGYQSRADDGSFIAQYGRHLRRLSPTGAVVAEFATPVSREQTAPKTSYFRGPFKPEISPDGSKVAYEYWYQEYSTDPGCGPVGNPSCTDSRVSVGIGYSHADRLTAWDEPGLGRQSGWIDPSWIDNTTLLQSDKSVRPNVDAIIDHPGDGNQTIERWFEDTGVWYVRDGEVSRRGDAAAFLTTLARSPADLRLGQEDDQITIYKLNGAPPALPEQCFSFQNPEAIYASPTFAPDGARVAWASRVRDGGTTSEILVGDIPSQAGGCQLPSSGGRTLIADARQPDWSPAAVPVIPGGGPAGSPGASPPGTQPGRAPGLAPAASGVSARADRVKLRRALSRGFAVRLDVPAAGSIKLTATRAGRTVATGSTRSTRASSVTVTARFTRAARRAMRRTRTAKLRVAYTFTPASGAAIRGSIRVTLRR